MRAQRTAGRGQATAKGDDLLPAGQDDPGRQQWLVALTLPDATDAVFGFTGGGWGN